MFRTALIALVASASIGQAATITFTDTAPGKVTSIKHVLGSGPYLSEWAKPEAINTRDHEGRGKGYAEDGGRGHLAVTFDPSLNSAIIQIQDACDTKNCSSFNIASGNTIASTSERRENGGVLYAVINWAQGELRAVALWTTLKAGYRSTSQDGFGVCHK